MLAGGDVIAPQRVDAGRAAVVERKLHQGRPLAFQEIVDQRASERHARGVLLQELAPVRPPRIGNGADDHRLLLVGQREHLRDHAWAVFRVVAEHAGDKADAEPLLLLVAEQAELVHGFDGGGHARGRLVLAIVGHPVHQALGRGERTARRRVAVIENRRIALLRRRGVARLRHDHVGQRVGRGLAMGAGGGAAARRRGLSRSGLRWRCGGCCRSLRRGGLRHGHGRDLARRRHGVQPRGCDDVLAWRRQALRRLLLRDRERARRRYAPPFALREAGRGRGEQAASGERNCSGDRHAISFLPPGPGLLTITRTWLMEAGPFSRRKHHDFQALRGFLRAGLN